MSFTYMETGSTPTAYRAHELPVFLSHERCMPIVERVLDEKGNIIGFPGVVEDERWKSKQRVGLCPDVRYEAQFHALDGQEFLMLWLVQPSGWHWVDSDGFGFSGDSLIMLWSVLDGEGNFKKKFELFSIDQTRYCHQFDGYLG